MRHAASQALQSTIKRNHVISEKKKPSHAVSSGTRGIVSELSVVVVK